jgi:predicted nucleic acid-binding protein
MIVLDTNVLSELTKPAPAAVVLDWFEMQPPASTMITAITQAEMLFGMEILAKGKRRVALQSAMQGMFDDFAGRILPFDTDAARHNSNIAAYRRALGRPITELDALIAAIVRSNGAVLATRNTDDFEHCGITVLNPWTATPGKVRR